MKTQKNIQQTILSQLIKFWKLRYETPDEVITESIGLKKQSEKIEFERGVYAAEINILAVNFLMSKYDESILSKLYEIINFYANYPNSKENVNVLNLTANVLHSYGDFKNSMELCLKAKQKAQELDLSEPLAYSYSICGLIYLGLADYDKAIENFKHSQKIRQELNNPKALASSLNLIARTYSLSKKYADALNYYNKSLQLRQEINDASGLPWTYIGIASTYEQMNDYVEAIKNYEKALDLNKIDDKRCELHCYLGLGSVKSIIAPSRIAEDYLLKAEKIAEGLNSKPILYKIYKTLSELYERLLDIPKAFSYFKKYQETKENVVNAQLQNQLKNKEIIFEVERTRKEAEIYRLKHIELKQAYDELEKKNREITDSINYARNIQVALLSNSKIVTQHIAEMFILFKPRDIVSGDFYWFNQKGNKLIIVVADCTGHGVPGAFMSMLGIAFLNEIVNIRNISKPALILNELRKLVISSLNKNKETGEVSDGMDISLVSINIDTLYLQYAGAFNPLYIFRQSSENQYILEQINGDRMPIGLYIKDEEPFLNKEFQLQKNDALYMFSDGYADQFGGRKEKIQKFMKKRFRNLLFEVQNLSMPEQAKILTERLTSWQGDRDQTDDITVIGLKI